MLTKDSNYCSSVLFGEDGSCVELQSIHPFTASSWLVFTVSFMYLCDLCLYKVKKKCDSKGII